jgi:cytidine deaminase
MAEFSLDMVVLIADGEGRLIQETSVRELLPGAFGPENLTTQRRKEGREHKENHE